MKGADMEYVSAIEVTARWGITSRTIHYYFVEGRIAGAQVIDGTWIIPENALKPADKRKKLNKASEEYSEEQKKTGDTKP